MNYSWVPWVATGLIFSAGEIYKWTIAFKLKKDLEKIGLEASRIDYFSGEISLREPYSKFSIGTIEIPSFAYPFDKPKYIPTIFGTKERTEETVEIARRRKIKVDMSFIKNFESLIGRTHL